MYRDRINTDVLLANLFATGKRNCYTFEELEEYYNCFTDVASDFCESNVLQCANRYPTLFRKYDDNELGFVIGTGVAQPNLQFFNAAYSEDMQDYIRRVTDSYVSGL